MYLSIDNDNRKEKRIPPLLTKSGGACAKNHEKEYRFTAFYADADELFVKSIRLGRHFDVGTGGNTRKSGRRSPKLHDKRSLTEILSVYPTPPSSVVDVGPINPQDPGEPLQYWNGTGPQHVIHYCRITFGNQSFTVQNDPIMSCLPFNDSRLANWATWWTGWPYTTYIAPIFPAWPTY